MRRYSGFDIDIENEVINKEFVVYSLSFPNGKFYIGQTTQRLGNRISEHCSSINKKKRCFKLSNAIKKYKTFKVSILQKCSNVSQLNSFEAFYIRLFDSINDGYNVDCGGNNKRLTDERKKQISISSSGRHCSQETRKKMSDWQIGKRLSDETKAKISNANKGKTASDSARLNQRIATGCKLLCVEDDIIFNSFREADEYYGVNIKGIMLNVQEAYSKKLNKHFKRV